MKVGGRSSPALGSSSASNATKHSGKTSLTSFANRTENSPSAAQIAEHLNFLNDTLKDIGATQVDMTQYAGKESQYLKAGDLQGGNPTVQVESVELVEFEKEGKKDIKPALKLVGKEKKLTLNATNTEKLIRSFGPQSEDWVGKSIMLGTQYYPAFDKEGLVVTPMADEPSDDIPF